MGITIVLKRIFNEQIVNGEVVSCEVECPTCGGEGGVWAVCSAFDGHDACWHRCPRCDGDGMITASPEEAQQLEQEHAERQLRDRAETYLKRRYGEISFYAATIRDYWRP
jgi:hypothetical protein